jgi:hypothetical protein
MEAQKLILVETVCTHYQLQFSFVEQLEEVGLISLVRKNEVAFIPEEKVSDLEKVLRIHEELNVNLEGIDIIINLLKKVESLQNELVETKLKLHWYSDES